MKIHSIGLKNYRGTTTREVSFSPLGITCITGPNESGKSSIREALGFLIKYPDNSSKMQAVRPVHNDEPTEIEADIESGPYRFTYWKQWFKKSGTKLKLINPQAQDLRGREAHDRVLEILNETLDMDLWEALMVEQGDAVTQPKVKDTRSLREALDRVAGGSPAAPAENALFAKVEKECALYYTPGREDLKKEHAKLAADVLAREQELHKLQEEHKALEADIDSIPKLQTRLQDLSKMEAEASQIADDLQKQLDVIARLENDKREAEGNARIAGLKSASAKRELQARRVLITEVEALAQEITALQEDDKNLLAAFTEVEKQWAEAQKDLKTADEASRNADTLYNLRQNDLMVLKDKFSLTTMEERKKRVDEARDKADKARAQLVTLRIDDPSFKKIQEADRVLQAALARQSANAPEIIYKALKAHAPSINGAPQPLEAEQDKRIAATETTSILIPGIAEIVVKPGTSARELTDSVEKARAEFDRLCSAAGVATLEDARQAQDARKSANQAIDDFKRVELADLRDLSYDRFRELLADTRVKVETYFKERPAQPAMAPDQAQADNLLKEAKNSREKALEALQNASQILERVRTVYDAQKLRSSENGLALKHKRDALKSRADLLTNQQKSEPDATLEQAAKEAEQAFVAAERGTRDIDARLREANPDSVRARAKAAKDSLDARKRDIVAVQSQLDTALGRLEAKGDSGLLEKIQDLEKEKQRLETTSQALQLRASAAKLLFDTLREERDNATNAYRTPLKERIERLGRILFNSTFQVSIDENLVIASRTLDGKTVDFESLSVGTREQLGLMYRLACSMIVSPDGGMPVLLDDALGYTDKERLKGMGAVLSEAAQHCQIIVFTCMPERYAMVGAARMVEI